MTKKSHIVLLFSVLILLNLGCKKNPFDYRTKYIGDYDFVNSWSSWTMSGSGPITSSGIRYTSGKIDYEKKGSIRVTFDNNSPTYYEELEVDKDGNLKYSGGPDAGTISKTKIYYYYSGGGLGSQSTSNINGTKK